MRLEVDIRKTYGAFSLAARFEADSGRTGLLGASGCGKSLTLRCIAGIERPDEGRIAIDGRVVFDSSRKINVPPQRRRVGYLFQSYALFPTMTVEENVAIACGRMSAQDRRIKVRGLLERFRVADKATLRPSQLSGGQQQRVALARMLAADPAIILLDEPFSALDSCLRRSTEDELSDLLADAGVAVVFVSHDRDEVFRFCQRTVILSHGRVVRQGGRDEVFNDPRTVEAARLTGCKNIARAVKAGERRVAVPAWGVCLDTARPIPEYMTHVGIRAHHIREASAGDERNCFDFAVERRREGPFSSTETLTAVTASRLGENEGARREALIRESEGHDKGEPTTRLCLPPNRILFLS
jgi:molybdate transport system ATP-binding protein